jgi:DNA-binding LytR/AlgR family response regulator
MRVLIVEDEGIAADRLIALIKKIEPNWEIVGLVDSVKSAVRWFGDNAKPDLAFFDIQLADGPSFEIFKQVSVSCPIIFTTAYDQYALQAFKVNSMDYLLKPIKLDELSVAINKFSNSTANNVDMNALMSLMKLQTQRFKERFIIKVGEHLKSIDVSSVRLFYSQDKSTYLYTDERQKFLLDFTLDQIKGMINPADYYRINRKFIVSMQSIADILSFSNSRLKLRFHDFDTEDAIVARERVGAFKEWLDR